MRRPAAWALGRVLAVLLIIGGSAPEGLRAQAPDTVPKPRVPSYVRYGKWIALGGAVALGYRANALHQDANDTYQSLQDRCFEFPDDCIVAPGGRYSDPDTERLYQDTQDTDRRAGRYLIGAEVAFAAAAVGFVWELVHREDETPNIPFEPRVEAGRTGTRVGLTVRF